MGSEAKRTRRSRTQSRFWKYVQVGGPDECWPWTGGLTRGGYGHCYMAKTGMPNRSNRLAWEFCNGRKIPEGREILHSCDNPACCNPEHLSVGTRLDNAREAAARGLYQRGEGHYKAKLTEAQAMEILSQCGGLSHAEVGRRYGVAKSTVESLRNGKSWKHLHSGKA